MKTSITRSTARTPEAARSAMRLHLSNSRERLRLAMAENAATDARPD